jgi:uncharacterized Zn finger protein
MSWFEFRPYVPVAQRRANAAKEVAKRTKKGESVSPVTINGRKIATTFWGKSWCENLESYSDFANRLPRGRSYVCNGSVVDLKIKDGKITALVSGSELYTITIDIKSLPHAQWLTVKQNCKGKIGSLVSLLQGKLSAEVMAVVTNKANGLFPKPSEITMRCSCPDYAGMCKHVAATMYGVGNRLDASPELLFTLRGVDHKELIDEAIPAAPTTRNATAPTLANNELSDIFGIDLGDATPATTPTSKTPKKPNVTKKNVTVKKVTAQKVAVKKVVVKKSTAKQGTTTKKKPLPKKG